MTGVNTIATSHFKLLFILYMLVINSFLDNLALFMGLIR